MKNILHNIQILTMLTLTMVGIQSCSDELQNVSEVQARFTATLLTDTYARSFGKAEQVNTLVVGVFDTLKNEMYRKSFPINGTSVDVQLALAKEQIYSFVFWAYDSNQNIYNIDDLTAIEMNTPSNPITFSQAEAADVFFATMEKVTIFGDGSYLVKLVRPLVQINVGTTGISMKTTFTAKSVPDTFYPFTNTVSGTTDYTWNFSEITSEVFLADEKEYNYLAMGYVFAPTTATKISAELILIDGENNKKIEFPQVKIEANQRSNIAGNFTPTE